MKSFSSKTFVLVTIVSGILLSSLALAAPSKVAGGKHDLSYNGLATQHDTVNPTATQVCVYCHTPHNAGKSRLLWNKDVKSATGFRLYTSSSSLTNAVKHQGPLSADSPSLLCLSCHDGKTAINVLHAGGKGGDAAPAGYPAGSKFSFGNAELVMPGSQNDFFGNTTPNLAIGRGSNEQDDLTPTAGDDLRDDHPIGFSYTAAQGEKPAALNGVATPEAAGIRFFGPSKKVECSTCHDPHVNYTPATGGDASLRPFLVMSNTGSALCLKCHNK